MSTIGNELPSAEELLTHHRARRQSVDNFHSVTLWEDTVEGRENSWTKVTIHSEKLHRIRYFEEHGGYEGDHQVPSRTYCRLFDGQITVNFDYNFDVENGQTKGDGSLTHASVFDGVAPGVHGPFSMRTPLGFINYEFISTLERCLAHDDVIDIACPNAEKPHVIQVLCHEKSGVAFDHLFVVDRSMDWVAVSLKTFDQNGVCVKTKEVDYQQTDSGVWLPNGGSYKKLVADVIKREDVEITLPKKEWRFQCIELTVNDAQFPQQVFDIVLEPETYVYDSRFGVDYQIGREKAIGSDLEKLAAIAKRKQAQDPSQNPLMQGVGRGVDASEPLEAIGKGNRYRFWILFLNAAVFLALAFYLFVTRRNAVTKNK